MEVTISPIYIADTLIDGYVITLHDVTSLRLLTRNLSRQALHDPLTGLLNRRGFESRVREGLDRKQTSNIDHSLCYIDLDHFKSINDRYGHKAGDDALQQFVSVTQECIRDSDSFGRLGGDEFAILLYGCNLEKAEKIVGDICSAVAHHPFTSGAKKFSMRSVSAWCRYWEPIRLIHSIMKRMRLAIKPRQTAEDKCTLNYTLLLERKINAINSALLCLR